ncbi:MAG TPA: YIP1 family protein [Bacteroidota bacterium]|nr:YIP1 family protein [Bacteroidota bacterium]
MDSTTPVPESAEEMSFTDKMVNVISAPGEVFSYVAREGKKSSNYSIPLLLSIIVSVLFMFVVFSQPAIKEEMSAQQEKALQKQVDEGKITPEQYDRAREMTPGAGSPMFLIFGSLGVVIVTIIMLFGTALVYWLVGKYAFHADVPYGKVAEVVGLSSYVMIIGSVITMVIAIAMGSINAGPHLGLLVGNAFDPMNKVHKLLASVNIVTLWYLAVVAIGLSKIFSIQTSKAFITVGILWVLFVAATVGFTFGG